MIATTRAALIRGTTTTDPLGDETTTDDVVEAWGDFPISIIETGADVFDPSSGEWRTIEKLVGRTAVAVPIDDGDRIRDNRDGAIYIVADFVRTPRTIAGRASVTMTLERTAP